MTELVTEIGLGGNDVVPSVDDDLFDMGMTSHATVRLMLALEEEFDIEFPDEMLQRECFATLKAIQTAVLRLAGDR